MEVGPYLGLLCHSVGLLLVQIPEVKPFPFIELHLPVENRYHTTWLKGIVRESQLAEVDNAAGLVRT